MSLKDITFLCWMVVLLLIVFGISAFLLAAEYHKEKRKREIEHHRIELEREQERQRAQEEEEKRRLFSDSLSLEEFTAIAESCAKKFRRIQEVSIGAGSVTCFVESQTSKTIWEFTVFFTTNGRITGSYGITSDVSNSDIPEAFAEMMSQRLFDRLGNDFSSYYPTHKTVEKKKSLVLVLS